MLRLVRGRQQVIFQSELTTESDGVRNTVEEAVRSALENESVDLVAAQSSADTGGGFHETYLQVLPITDKKVGGGQPRDSPANNEDAATHLSFAPPYLLFFFPADVAASSSSFILEMY